MIAIRQPVVVVELEQPQTDVALDVATTSIELAQPVVVVELR